LDSAPSLLGDTNSLSRREFNHKLSQRREWAGKVLREYENPRDVPSGIAADLARVNSEMDQLINVGKVRFQSPLDNGMIHPGEPANRGQSHPSILKAGYWSKPFREQLGNKALVTGSVVVPSLLPGIVTIPDRPIFLTQAIPSTQLEGTNLYSYLQETVRIHAAAEVASGAQKPVSTYTVQRVDDTVRTIATISQPVNRFDLEDQALLDQYLQGSLAKAVQLRLDSQILNGNGTAPNLRGILNTAGIQAQAFATDVLQTARKAKTLLYQQEIYDPAAMVYVMSPAQWEVVELAQLTTGAYIMQNAVNGAPVNLAAQRLWGSPVIVTDALSGNNAVLFAPQYTQLWERSGVQVDFSEAPIGSVAGVPGFSTNEITFRAEGRWGFGVTKPSAVVEWATS
jgi:HK97 family phage major capsid protein